MLKKLKTVAAANNLLVTGGSDYHGAPMLHPMAGRPGNLPAGIAADVVDR